MRTHRRGCAMDPVDLTKRLALIRYLYQAAERQATLPLPTGALAVLSLHDCLEWFIITVSEHFGIDPGRTTLLESFDKIAKESQFSNKSTLAKVLSARRELKHRLTLPASSSITELCLGTKIFLVENSAIVFFVDFETVSLVDMIQNERIRYFIEKAITLRGRQEYITAMHEIENAYIQLQQAFQLNLRLGWPMTCGIDSLELMYFDRLIPSRYRKQAFVASEESCDFCLEFVIDATIKIEQQFSNNKARKLENLLSRIINS
jgi:hypothetical protein